MFFNFEYWDYNVGISLQEFDSFLVIMHKFDHFFLLFLYFLINY